MAALPGMARAVEEERQEEIEAPKVAAQIPGQLPGLPGRDSNSPSSQSSDR